MKKQLIFFVLLMIVNHCIAIIDPYEIKVSESPNFFKKGSDAFYYYQFSKAAVLFQKYYNHVKLKENKAKAAYMTGMCFKYMNDYKKSEYWFDKALAMEIWIPDIYRELAEAQKRQGKYHEASLNFKEYLREVPSDSLIGISIKYCDSAITWIANPVSTNIDPVKSLNTKFNDFCPAFFENEAIVFTSDRPQKSNFPVFIWTGLPFKDIYLAQCNQSRKTFEQIQPFPVVNTSFNEGVVSFNGKFDEMYYTQCNGSDGKLHHCRIMYSQKRGKVWTVPAILPFCKDSFVHYAHPSISSDGRKLYFCSNMPGGEGSYSSRGSFMDNMDIWMCSKVGRSNGWSDPVNLGNSINTSFNEQFPYVFENNQLYFSSDRPGSMGGLDIFMSEKSEIRWSEPVNLKYPFNSCADDFGIILNKGSNYIKGRSGYLTSNRNPKTKDDIFYFYEPPLLISLEGTVFNKKTGLPEPDATVFLFNEKRDTTVKVNTDGNGHYTFSSLDFEAYYQVFAEKDSFWGSPPAYVSTIGQKRSEVFIRNLIIDPFRLEEITLEGIFFELDSFRITAESALVLDSLANSLKRYPFISIELGSHTDCRESFDYNIELSWKRAFSCRDYLVSKGIDPERLVPQGYGEIQLVTDCPCENMSGKGMDCSEKEHAINRRTTIRILRIDYRN